MPQLQAASESIIHVGCRPATTLFQPVPDTHGQLCCRNLGTYPFLYEENCDYLQTLAYPVNHHGCTEPAARIVRGYAGTAGPKARSTCRSTLLSALCLWWHCGPGHPCCLDVCYRRQETAPR